MEIWVSTGQTCKKLLKRESNAAGAGRAGDSELFKERKDGVKATRGQSGRKLK